MSSYCYCDKQECNGWDSSLTYTCECLQELPGDSKGLTGLKFDSEKPRMDLLPMDALVEVGKVLGFGAKKYGDRNWEKGITLNRLRAAILRHDAAVEMGEDLDPESKLLHRAHKACDCLMELSLYLRGYQ